MSEEESPVLENALARVRKEGTYTAYMAAKNALDPRRATGSEVRIGILRNFTVEPMLPVIDVELALDGLSAVTYVGDFDAIAADALDPQGGLARFHAEAVILALWLEGLSPRLVGRYPSLSAEEANAEIARVLAFIREMLTGIRRFSEVPILLNNFPLPGSPAFGILDAQSDHSQTESFLALNRGIRALARDVGNVFVVDYMSLFAAVGMNDAFDERNWVHRKSPLGRRALIPVGQEYAKFVRALRGKVRKCVIVDCDNTLWGGIIGEDGINGIQLGETASGSAYVALQRELLNLYDRGILIALCSKNNEADVFEALRNHPCMLLREIHVSAHRINWDDKASNIRAIAKELNIGLDSLVFIDDSAFECGLVREQLPEVAVVELNIDTHDLASQLTRRGFFDSLTVSKEDKQRTAHFKAEATRREIQGSAGSLEEFLGRLEMVAEIGLASEETIPRVAQLTQKTNQFNLTTRRYTEDEIRRMVDSNATDVLYVRLRDKVADLGIIGVAIIRYENQVAEIDTLLMSCRALGRGVELVILDELRRRAEESGCSTIRGLYIPTLKNAQVATFYASSGFRPDRDDGPPYSYLIDVSDLKLAQKPITVIRIGTPQPQS